MTWMNSAECVTNGPIPWCNGPLRVVMEVLMVEVAAGACLHYQGRWKMGQIRHLGP